MIEREAWVRLRAIRRMIVSTATMLRQTYYATAWHILEDQMEDLRFERAMALRDLRTARDAHRRLRAFR